MCPKCSESDNGPGEHSVCPAHGVDTTYGPCQECLFEQPPIDQPPTDQETPPVDPVVPVDPEQPVDPVVPVDPEQPVDPVVPVDPEQPVDPVVPVDPEQPVDPVVPVDPEQPVDPVVPVDPEQPVDPVVPVDPEQPEEPVNPVKPVQPEEPVNPVDPVNPANPLDPEVPAVGELAAPTDLKVETFFFTRNACVIMPEEKGYVKMYFKDNATGEDGFKVERADRVGVFTEIMTLPAHDSNWTVSFTDSGESLRGGYNYRVRAYKGSAYSGYSNEAYGYARTSLNAAFPYILDVSPLSVCPGQVVTVSTKYVYSDTEFTLTAATLVVADSSDYGIADPAGSKPVNALKAVYDIKADKLYLRSIRDPNVLIGGFAPGSDNVISNELGALYCKNTTVQLYTQADTRYELVMDWAVSVTRNSCGYRIILTSAKDAYGYWGCMASMPLNVSLNPVMAKMTDGKKALMDRKGQGIYKRDKSGTLQELPPVNMYEKKSDQILPVDLSGSGVDSIYCDMSWMGLWAYEGSAWRNILPNDVLSMTAVKFNAGRYSQIVGNFREYGVYVYYPDTNNWEKLADANPAAMLAVKTGVNGNDNLIVNIGSCGGNNALWMYTSADKTWKSMDCPGPRDMEALDDDSDDKDEVYADFGALGLWRWDNGAWTQIAPLDQNSVVLGMAGCHIDTHKKDFMVSVKGAGTWIWHNASKLWAKLCDPECYQIEAGDIDDDGKDELFMDFGPLGMWQCRVTNNVPYWEKITD